MSAPLHRTYRDYSGVKIVGTQRVKLPTTQLHMERAYYVMAQLEAPVYGTVQSYDGAGISGGPPHWVAVYPHQKGKPQGHLWALIHALLTAQIPSSKGFQALLDEHNLQVSSKGKLVSTLSGYVLPGTEVIDLIAPPNGKVPRSGPKWRQAVKWAQAFHLLLDDPAGLEIQKAFTIDWLLRTQYKTESIVYDYNDFDPDGTEADPASLMVATDEVALIHELPLWTDIAMCAYHAFSVNAPGTAVRALRWAQKREPELRSWAFAEHLIWKLGTSSYGNWKVRYRRTRSVMRDSELWPKEMLEQLMPLRLPGSAKGFR